MRRGEVWWVEDPETGRRPALILTRSEAIPVLNKLTVVPATRTVRGIATEVELGPDDGMPDRCALTFDNLRTASKSLLTARITALGVERMQQVCVALRRATGC